MNKVGIYNAFWVHDWDADVFPFVSKVARLGFDILEINPGGLLGKSDADRQQFKKAMEQERLELTICVGLGKDCDIASEDVAARRKGINTLRTYARLMREMDSRNLSGIVYGYWPAALPDGVSDKRPYFDRSVEAMKEAVKTAEDCGCFFNIEPVNRFEHYMINTALEALEYVERVGSKHCRVLLDTFHMNIEEDSFREAILAVGDRLGHVHVGEPNRRAPGRGRMPWDEIFGALKEINYTGAVVMEPFILPGGSIGRDIKVNRDLSLGIEDLDAEAQRALHFVREKLRYYDSSQNQVAVQRQSGSRL